MFAFSRVNFWAWNYWIDLMSTNIPVLSGVFFREADEAVVVTPSVVVGSLSTVLFVVDFFRSLVTSVASSKSVLSNNLCSHVSVF